MLGPESQNLRPLNSCFGNHISEAYHALPSTDKAFSSSKLIENSHLLWVLRSAICMWPYASNIGDRLFATCTSLYDSCCYVLRHDGVVVEFHGRRAAAFGHTAQRSYVAEHFGERYFGPNHFQFSPVFHGFDLPALAREVPRDVTHEFLRHDYFHFHNRLENNGLSALGRFLEGLGGSG